MAEEKKVEAKAEEAKAEPKVVYEYKVRRFDNGLYDFEGVVLEGAEVPSIDKYHIATDLVELGRKLDHQLTVEEAEQRVFGRLQEMAQAQAQAAASEDPTKA